MSTVRGRLRGSIKGGRGSFLHTNGQIVADPSLLGLRVRRGDHEVVYQITNGNSITDLQCDVSGVDDRLRREQRRGQMRAFEEEMGKPTPVPDSNGQEGFRLFERGD